MIWNEDILFLHVPKTGGMSVTEFLLNNLRGTVRYTSDTRYPGTKRAQFVKGTRHETLADAESYFTYRNRSIYDFDAVFAVMRNPYDLEVSRYHYLRQGLKVDRGPAQDLALEGDYRTYLEKAAFFGANPPRLDRYFRLGDTIPANMQILRNEYLEADLRTRLAPYLVEDQTPFPHTNTSDHDAWTEYYDDVTEELCYRRHRWFFDLGFYPRYLDAYPAGELPVSTPARRADASPRGASPANALDGAVEDQPPFPAEIPEALLGAPKALGTGSLAIRGARAFDRLTTLTGRSDLDGLRLLDLGCGADLGRHVSAKSSAKFEYLGLDSDGPLLDFLRQHVHDTRLRYGAIRLDGGMVSAALESTFSAPSPEPFDIIWSGGLFETLDADELVAVLRFCAGRASAETTLVASVNLFETSESKEGLFDLVVGFGLMEPETDQDIGGPTPEGHYLYSRRRLAELIGAGGWRLMQVHEPIKNHRHAMVCKPAA